MALQIDGLNNLCMMIKHILAKTNSYEAIKLVHFTRMFFIFRLPILFRETFHRSRIINSIVWSFLRHPLYSSKICFIIIIRFILLISTLNKQFTIFIKIICYTTHNNSSKCLRTYINVIQKQYIFLAKL